MSEEITYHRVPGLNEALIVRALDEPGPGGACHSYVIHTPNKPLSKELESPQVYCEIDFQNGPLQETGPNGVSIEALLAVVEHRLAGFQAGEFACQENEVALMYTRAALEVLHKRTLDRLQRGVEGKLEK